MLSNYVLDKRSLKNGQFWYARFYNESTNSYSVKRSLKLKCTNTKKNIIQAGNIAKEIMDELNRASNIYLINYAISFWKEDSKYAKMKKHSENKPLSKAYIKLCSDAVKKHVLPYKPFKNLLISDLTKGLLEDWKLWSLEKNAGREQINTALKAIRVAVRNLIDNGDINIKDPFNGVKNVSVTSREKGILYKEEVQKLINIEYSDPRIYIAVNLAIHSGLRRGELRGLLWEDFNLEKGIIYVRNNYVDSEGLKECKCGSNRIVPLPNFLKPKLKLLKQITPYRDDKDFVLFSVDNRKRANNRNIPLSINSIRAGFKKILININISEHTQKERNLTLHGMRHTFVTIARMAGIPDLAVQTLAGHKSAEMMNRYSHGNQAIDLSDIKNKLHYEIKG